MDIEKILAGLVRVGSVTAIDNGKRIARMKFQDSGITSDWLAVLDTHPHIPDYDGEPQRTEYAQGGEGEAQYERHKHDLTIKPWMPLVGDLVVALFLPVFNGHGFILGRFNPWQ